MIEMSPGVFLGEEEIEWRYARASGPGGQHVNKVATAAQLRFDLLHSPSLPDELRIRLIRLSGSRLTRDGILVIDARRFRSRERNRQDALDRLRALIARAGRKPKPRRKTRPTRASRERRLSDKKQRGATKKLRGAVPPDGS